MGDPLELRILSGLHRQARCTARHDDVLGSDLDCDVVLSDEGVPARAAILQLSPLSWGLRPEDGHTPPEDPSTPFNEPLALGPVWITVARETDPWPPTPEPAYDETPKLPETSPESHGPESSGNGPAPTLFPMVMPAPSKRSRRDTWLVSIGIAAVLCAVIVALLMTSLLGPADSPITERPDPQAAARRSLGQINTAIEQLGLASRLHVTIRPDGMAYVTGWVRNRDERDALAAALSRIWPMPAMAVSSEAEALARAVVILKGFPIKYEPSYEGNGRLAVAGIAESSADRDAALAAVRAQLPGMTVIGNGIILADAVVESLSRELKRANLGGIALSWRSDRLNASAGSLDDEQRAKLAAILANFNARNFNIAMLDDEGKQYANTVPFGIRAVVSGPAPYIVLDTGDKLGVGGIYKRYRLTAIEDERLLFDGPRSAIVLR